MLNLTISITKLTIRILEESCVQDILVQPQFERLKNKVFNYALENLKATKVDEKLDEFFIKLKCTAKMNLPFGFISKNVEQRGFESFYTHEIHTLVDRCKFLCTKEDLAKLKHFLYKTDVIESCSREKMKTKWRFHKLSNLSLFEALLRDISMVCKDAVSSKCFFFAISYSQLFHFRRDYKTAIEGQLVPFCVLAFPVHGNQRDWKKKQLNSLNVP